jgi:hypothetical protein
MARAPPAWYPAETVARKHSEQPPPLQPESVSDGTWWSPEPPRLFEPELFIKPMKTGRNHAIVVGALDLESGRMDRCLIKPGMWEPRTSLIEWVSASLVRAIGLKAPDSFVVRLTPEFIETLPEEVRARVGEAPSEIYGSGFVDGIQPCPSVGAIERVRRSDAWRLLGLDAFIHNVDRRKGNPNTGLHNGTFLAYDHDCALSFVCDIMRDDERAIVGTGIPWILDHLFAGRFASTPMPDAVHGDIGKISDEWFARLRACTPSAWLTDDYQQIQSVIVPRSRRTAEWLPQVEQCTM